MALADFVRERKEEVLDAARRRVEELMPGHPPAEATDYLPGLLEQLLLDVGDGPIDAGASATASNAADHGRGRQELGVGIQIVAHDFGVLCDAIAETADRAGASIEAGDWKKLNKALDLGIATAISAYEDRRRAQEREEAAAEVGGIAHELRNALGAASLAFEAVKRGRVGTNSRTADIVTRNLKSAALLAADLLAGSKNHGAPDLDVETFPLRPLLEDVVSTIPGDRAPVTIRSGPEVTIHADRKLLISAVTNLVQNAVKFTRAGTVVEVRAAESGGATVIEVEDRCGGLPPGASEVLFAPFVQRGADRSGAGLGLSIVRKIMLAHQGSALVRDLAGEGCVFELRFPRSPEAAR